MTDDLHHLEHFVQEQASTWERALAELRAGRKATHWMWYVFPQLAGLGRSDMARRFSIRDASEARAYLAHPVLGPRLRASAEALLGVAGRSAHAIMGSPDDVKLQSSATLFASVSAPGSVFHRLLERFFDGEEDERTLALLDAS